MTSKKLLKWEFWPFWIFYIPVYVKYLWLSLKAGTMAFFTAANPLMKHGGFTDYSKYDVLKHIKPKFLPFTFLISDADYEKTAAFISEKQLKFPLIFKPDLGERGFGVEKLNNLQSVKTYFNQGNIGDLIIQEYVDYPLELGVMYSKKTSEKSGMINSVVMKEFLKIKGDGESTLKEIILNDKRAQYYVDGLLELYVNDLDTVIEDGYEKELVAIGNHSRGTTFLNANHLINDKLVKVFDEISSSIPGYHFGRYDLRVPNEQDLYEGKNIKIMELNGAASEPAHIYDPEMPILTAYKYLFEHWQRLYEISIENHKKGIPYTSTFGIVRDVRKRGRFKKSINIKI